MLRWITVVCLAGPWMFLAEPFPRPAQDEKVNKLIVQFLQDKDAKKRRLALLELEIVGPRAKGVLQAMSIVLEKDSEPVVRREVALALGRMGADAQAAIPALAFALKNDKDDTVREASARALLQMEPHSARALQQLIEALQDSHGPTRAAAAEALKLLGEQSRSAVPQLIEYLKSPKDKKSDAAARVQVALALGRVGEEGSRGTTALITVVSDPAEDVLVRVAAADSLGRFGLDAQGAAKPLADILGNNKNDQTLRLAAVKALAKVEGNTRQVWPALKIGLGDGDAMVRILTVRATGPYGKEEPEAVKILARLARNDDNVEVRLAAIQELGLIGSAAKTAEPDLRYIIEHDERETVREQAEVAVKRILGKSIP
jgi:HEAT repeat protein